MFVDTSWFNASVPILLFWWGSM